MCLLGVVGSRFAVNMQACAWPGYGLRDVVDACVCELLSTVELSVGALCVSASARAGMRGAPGLGVLHFRCQPLFSCHQLSSVSPAIVANMRAARQWDSLRPRFLTLLRTYEVLWHWVEERLLVYSVNWIRAHLWVALGDLNQLRSSLWRSCLHFAFFWVSFHVQRWSSRRFGT